MGKNDFRFNNVINIVCSLIIAVVLIGTVMVFPLQANADSSGCSLQIVTGIVEVQDAGTNTWRTISNTVFLKAGDTVRTAKDASALIIFLDGSSMELGNDTCISIKKANGINNNAAITVIDQFWGKTWNRVIKIIDPRSQYDVETPSCFASARGTYFTVEVTKTGLVTIQTIEGTVAVTAENKEVIVQDGYQVIIDKGNAPPAPSLIQGQSSQNNNSPEIDSVKLVSAGGTQDDNDNNTGSGNSTNNMISMLLLSMVIAAIIIIAIKKFVH